MKLLAAYLAGLAAAAMLCGDASAQTAGAYAPSSDPFAALVGKRRERRQERAKHGKVERYVLASDNRAFLFEDRSNTARLMFLCADGDSRLDCTLDPDGPAPEIYQVAAVRGPRGDVIYKNAAGETMLRMASYGGATVFWPGAIDGRAASKSFGDDPALQLTPQPFAAAQRRAIAATAAISALVGGPIVFDLSAAAGGGDNYAVLADAVMRAAKGVSEVADDSTGARIIASRIHKVAFRPAAAAGVALEDGVLVIRFVPDRDIEGRPSSSDVTRFLENTL